MVLFLLEMGARMDIPDMRNNVAFDVAPYTLLDKCMLSQQREKFAAEHEKDARLLEIHQVAVSHFEEVTLMKAHAFMLLIDWESRAWEEWLVLQATNKVDREWSEQVQKSKDTLEIKQAMYTDQQVLLQKEQDQIALMWKNIFRDAQHRQQCAREELEQMLMLTEETHQHWMQEQQELWDQCGLIEASQEFPNDEDVQQWVLCTIIALIDEECAATFINVAAVLKLLAIVLSNGKNMRYLMDHEYKIDVAVHVVLKKLLNGKQASHGSADDNDANSRELLAHILRVYLRFFDYERDHTKSGVNLHERCRAIGICAALHAFDFPDDNHRSKQSSKTLLPSVNANQSNENSTDSPQDSKFKTKRQLARAWSRNGVEQNSSRSPERETLCSLAQALLRHAPCRCYSS
ncbi:Intraflagellar Transport Protein 72/74 [Phytophthora cinnamomi]|uniref:Intraflagellar Transport Protein 72/74 n=1 Tax=Phytophthora cinnamomi TaxID=4785 RepID=UPI00355A3E2F|nr:Intraflagellar Transport Protein 72/74 [Phytophthora cinnamomi]